MVDDRQEDFEYVGLLESKTMIFSTSSARYSGGAFAPDQNLKNT